MPPFSWEALPLLTLSLLKYFSSKLISNYMDHILSLFSQRCQTKTYCLRKFLNRKCFFWKRKLLCEIYFSIFELFSKVFVLELLVRGVSESTVILFWVFEPKVRSKPCNTPAIFWGRAMTFVAFLSELGEKSNIFSQPNDHF